MHSISCTNLLDNGCIINSHAEASLSVLHKFLQEMTGPSNTIGLLITAYNIYR